MLTRKEILERVSADQGRTLEVVCPTLAGTLRVRGLTGSEREQLYNLFRGMEPGSIPKHYRATLVTWATVKEDGSRMFADSDVETVGALDFDTLRRLAEAIEKLSGLGEDPDDTAGNSVRAASG